MCRLYGFRSSVVSGVHQSLVAAENALGRQSVRHPDGWGVAFYHDHFPHLLRSDKQALEDKLFRDVSAVVSTRTLLAHIRQATVGDVNVLNCHPFQYGPWTFAHNGEVSGWGANGSGVAEAALAAIDPRFRAHVFGTTDSEVCFMVFLSRLARRVADVCHPSVRLPEVLAALRETVEVMREIECATGEDAQGPSKLTFLLTNGSILVGHRFHRELYFSTYKTLCPERETCHAYQASICEREVKQGLVKHLVVTSEAISEGPNVWTELADGEYVAVDPTMHFERGWLSER